MPESQSSLIYVISSLLVIEIHQDKEKKLYYLVGMVTIYLAIPTTYPMIPRLYVPCLIILCVVGMVTIYLAIPTTCAMIPRLYMYHV